MFSKNLGPHPVYSRFLHNNFGILQLFLEIVIKAFTLYSAVANTKLYGHQMS